MLLSSISHPLLPPPPFRPSPLLSFPSIIVSLPSLCTLFLSLPCIFNQSLFGFVVLPPPSVFSFTLLSYPPSLGSSRCYTVALGILYEGRWWAFVCVCVTLCAYRCLNMISRLCACIEFCLSVCMQQYACACVLY